MSKDTMVATVGFSRKDTLTLFWLFETQTSARYPKELTDAFLVQFPGHPIGYDYVARIAKQLEQAGHLSMSLMDGKKYYVSTSSGSEQLRLYEEQYYQRFFEVTLVIDRMYYYLTKIGPAPENPTAPLDEAFRPFLAKLLSVKDVIRYVALKLSQTRPSFYMAQVADQLDDLFGWSPSNGYLYLIAREMEETGLLIGHWPDERRTVRHLKGTDEGQMFFQTVEESFAERLKDVRSHLHAILSFLQGSAKPQ
ncbi:PadR family transcriptional regulator [Psychrobacillus sp. FSL H8-0484]|uniref:PadR family transcriptional regulator n=1 Tax=Psychrobacillus sp. FSL H8-0484 TaxID=2921390 RepID=UPI0030F8A93C